MRFMNDEKLSQLFHSVRGELAPAPEAQFELRVLRAIRNQSAPETVSLWDQLAGLFPRVAFASLALIALCVLADLGLATFEGSDLITGAPELPDQWLFPAQGF